MRFVILHHTGWPGHADHYDLMLQSSPGASDDDRVLQTFATVGNQFPTAGVMLRQINAHRREFLNYEGPPSGDRGSVRRVDEGELTLASGADFEFVLNGTRLNGRFRLRKTEPGYYVLERL